MNKVIFLFFIFLIPTASIYSQQVWPVQVTGSIIPPHSLDLKVYGNDRSTDLNFQVLLNDPEELALQVIPILTIEQNGNVIYQTDMNYSANPITLNQFSSYLLDGAALNQYLSAEALSGNNGIGKGATLIPEGFTQICLQMYGVDRTVPVSNKFCVSGNFRLNQAPQLIKPSFNDIIKMPPVQNMIFSWMPMHLSSGNNPGAVEYVFELVELPTGVMNANDVFESALKIYSTTVMSTSFIYSQSEPVLNPNTYYAWRVTAKSILYPTSLLFQNDGKSEISMFMMYDGDAPSTELNPFDNPAPRGCSVYETSYGPIAKADNESMILGANQEVKLGYFKMKITEAIGDIQNGYSGKGIVYYPMLRSSLEVEFKNIRVNKEGRVYEAEWIESKSDRLALSNEQLKAENISQSVNGDYANDLYNLIDDSKKVSLLSENGAKLNALPLALTNEKFPNTLVCVIGARFTPTNAYLNLIGLDLDDNNNSTRNLNVSAATAIPSTPYGLMSNAHLVPLSGASQKTELSDIQTILIANAQDKSSKLNCDCEGITDKKLSKTYIISPELIIVPSTKTPLSLSLSDKNQAFETYNGSIGAIPDFVINGINNLSLSAEGGILNLNNESKLNLPIAIKNSISGEISKGVLMTGLKAKLSEKFNLLNAKEVVLENGNLLIDANTIKYAKVSKENLIKLKDGIVDKWQFSVDEMNITINDGVIDGPRLTGQLKLPIASNTIPYSGSFDINANENPKLIINDKPKTLDVDMWKSKLELEDVSLITADIININNQNKILPKAGLTGALHMKMEGKAFLESLKGNYAEVKANLETVFKIQGDLKTMAIEGIKIPNWNIDPYNAPEKKYQSGKIDVSNASFVLNEIKFPISDAEIAFENKNGNERIGLRFSSVYKNSKMEFMIWAEDKNGQFVFDHIEQTKFILKCDCEQGTSVGWLNHEKLYDNYKNNPTELRTGGLASVNKASKNSPEVKYEMLGFMGISDTFKLINEKTLYWPLIDQEITVSRPFQAIEFKGKLLVTSQIFQKLGFKTSYNIPLESSLYITSLEISKLAGEDTKATILLTLESQYDPGNSEKLMVFASKKLEAKANSIKLDNVDLYLENPANPEEWDLKYYNWDRKGPSDQAYNLARIDCTSGFTYFQMKGEVSLKDMVTKEGKKEVKIPFTLNTSQNNNKHSLKDFIAICQDDMPRESKLKWNIHPKDLPQVSFKTGKNYSIYFDHSSLISSPKSSSSKAYPKSTSDKAFKGLIFEKVQAELFGFKDSLKNYVTLDMDDAVYVVGSADADGFYANLEKTSLFTENSGAKISGWKYGLDTVSFNIQKSKYQYDLALSGKIGIPFFKTIPDQIKSVKFDSSWVKFDGTVYVENSDNESRVSTYFEFDDISTKVYQSDFIPGLGVVLNEDSNISLEYHHGWQQWNPKGTFSGLGIVLLTSETMRAYGLKSFPDGMDLSLHCLTFEGLTLNEKPASASEAFIDEYGIKSIEFGTWGIVDYKSMYPVHKLDGEKKSDDKDSKDNEPKQDDKTPVKSTASGKIVRNKEGVKTVSTTSGRIIRNKEGTKVVSTASGSIKRTKNTNSSKAAAVTAKADTEPEFNSLKFAVSTTGIKATGTKFELGIGVTLSLLGDNKEKKGEKEEVKTCGLNAKGGVGLQFTKKDGKFIPEGVDLKCLAIDGSIGPVEFDGGLSILKTPKDAQGNPILNGNHGSGFKAYISATMMGLGGIQAVGQFGKKAINNTESFNYGFIDLEAFKQSGFAIPPPTPSNTPVIDLYGGGGGIRINMRSTNPVSELKLKPDSNIPPTSDCPIPDAKYLEPGAGLSQNYEPSKGTYGGNFYMILGPWNELDNQDPPLYSIIGEPGLDIEISTNKQTNELQFGKIAVNVNAYFKPSSLAKRRNENIADAYAKLELNWPDRLLVGAFGARMKVEVPGLSSPLLQIPEQYETTNFNTKANYVSGKAVFSFDNRDGKKPFFNFKFGGSSIGTYKSASGLSYNTALLNVEDILKVKAGAYFQIGHDVDNFPPIKELIPQITDMESNQYAAVKSSEKTLNSKGAGVSFGFKGTMEAKGAMGPLDGKMEVGLGFNVQMREMKGVNCSNLRGESIGIKGWYAQGQAFGYANGNINLNYNLIFHSGRVNIAKVGSFILLTAAAPNPSNFIGRINGTYSVLNGSLEGPFNYKVELGKKCEIMTLPSPLEGIYIFNEANITDGQTNVDRYTDIILGTNFALQSDFNVPQVDADGNFKETVSFQADVKSIELKSGQVTVPLNQRIQSNKKGINLTLDNPLLPNTEYILKYSFVWKKSVFKDGRWQFIEDFESGKKGEKSQPKIETGTIKFRTGDKPTKIMPNMVEYMAPGDGQRYWHKGYANTEIKFKLKALSDAVSLFPEKCTDCETVTGSPVKFKYYVRLQEFDKDGKLGKLSKIPITTYPNNASMADILKPQSIAVNNGQYNINVLQKEQVPISQVSFPELKNLDLIKGYMYELAVIREPEISDENLKTYSSKNSKPAPQNSSTIITTIKQTDNNVEKNKILQLLNDHILVLHTSYFAVSNYTSLQDKLSKLSVNHVKSIVKRRDFQHPNDAFDGQRAAAISQVGESKFHSVRDDYYAFVLDDNNEGFDQIDMMRLKRNIKLEYLDKYVPEIRVNKDRYGQKSLNAEFDLWLIGVPGYGNYVRKILYDYTKAENEGIAQYGNSNISDGTKWHYKIEGPTDPRRKLLQADEIAAKKVSQKTKFRSKNDPNFNIPVFDRDVEYDFLIQDLRSRIVINQMSWLSRMSNPSITSTTWAPTGGLTKWRDGNYPDGDFLQENRRFYDFRWILFGDDWKNEKGDQYTYIASEPGYQFSYHGRSRISFPSEKNWNELIESKRDKNETIQLVKEYSPNRIVTQVSEQKVTNTNELVENYWYRIKVGDRFLTLGDYNKGQFWTSLFTVGNPYKDFAAGPSQYGLYSLGAGGWPTIREFREIDKPQANNENIWNLTNPAGNAIRMLNERYKNYNGENPNETKFFPKVMDHSGFKFDYAKRLPRPPTWLPVDVELVELSGISFNPDKYYRIGDPGSYLKDKEGSDRWKIIQEGSFYRFQSSNGYIAKIDYYEEFKLFVSNIKTWNLKAEDKNFPDDRYKDPNGYFRSVWAVIPVTNANNYYWIKNIRYPDYFLHAESGKVVPRSFEGDYAEQILITEIKE